MTRNKWLSFICHKFLTLLIIHTPRTHVSIYIQILYLYIHPGNRKTRRARMESSLTEQEMEAVVQLIQLSGDFRDDFHVFWVNFQRQKEEDESVGETSSSLIDAENCLDTEVLPRMKIRVGSIADIYGKTGQPLMIKNGGRKRGRVWLLFFSFFFCISGKKFQLRFCVHIGVWYPFLCVILLLAIH